MKEVKLLRKTENIRDFLPTGIQISQPHQYLQLYFVESGKLVPDNIYKLKQGDNEVMCSIDGGCIRGAETLVDSNQPIFLM
jgi:hypothetical protein